MSWLIKLKQWRCKHSFYLEDLTRHPELEETNQRVSWACHKCGKVFKANCGLDISPEHGYMMRKPKAAAHKEKNNG